MYKFVFPSIFLSGQVGFLSVEIEIEIEDARRRPDEEPLLYVYIFREIFLERLKVL